MRRNAEFVGDDTNFAARHARASLRPKCAVAHRENTGGITVGSGLSLRDLEERTLRACRTGTNVAALRPGFSRKAAVGGLCLRGLFWVWLTEADVGREKKLEIAACDAGEGKKRRRPGRCVSIVQRPAWLNPAL